MRQCCRVCKIALRCSLMVAPARLTEPALRTAAQRIRQIRRMTGYGTARAPLSLATPGVQQTRKRPGTRHHIGMTLETTMSYREVIVGGAIVGFFVVLSM